MSSRVLEKVTPGAGFVNFRNTNFSPSLSPSSNVPHMQEVSHVSISSYTARNSRPKIVNVAKVAIKTPYIGNQVVESNITPIAGMHCPQNYYAWPTGAGSRIYQNPSISKTKTRNTPGSYKYKRRCIFPVPAVSNKSVAPCTLAPSQLSVNRGPGEGKGISSFVIGSGGAKAPGGASFSKSLDANVINYVRPYNLPTIPEKYPDSPGAWYNPLNRYFCCDNFS